MLVTLQYAFWILPAVLQAYLAVVMVRRGLRAEFPAFFLYTVFQVSSFMLKFPLYHLGPYKLYFNVYWSCKVLELALGFMVIHEVFSYIFRPYEALRDLGNVLFRWAAVVLVLVAAVMVLSSSGGVGLTPLMNIILTLDRSISMMQCGLVLLLLLFSSYVGLTNRNHVFGIALGFGLASAIDLCIWTVRARFGGGADTVFSLLSGASFLLAVVTWTGYLLSPDPERRTVQHVAALPDSWNYALNGITNPGANAPSLPLIESAVERIFQRKNDSVH